MSTNKQPYQTGYDSEEPRQLEPFLLIIEEALMPAGTTTLRQSHHHKELEMPFLLPIFLLEHLKMDV